MRQIPMKQFTIFYFVFLGAFLLRALPIYSQINNCTDNQNHPNYETITQVVGAETIVREYILYIPENYDANVAAPLVINMHGFGDCAAYYSENVGDYYGFDDIADQENIIVAYPQGAYRPDKEDHYWEPGDPGIDNIYDNDIYFIEELIAHVSSNYTLDTDMIFACGYSNGGMMTYSLGCHRSSVFAGIGLMSGAMLDDDCILENPVPVIKFHGVADFVLPYDGDMYYASVEETIELWLEYNNMSQSIAVSSDLNGGDVSRDEYTGNSCVTLYTIHEEWGNPGGHVWFSDNIDGLSPSQIMWDFFEEACQTISSTEDHFTLSIDIQPNPFINKVHISSDSHRGQDFTIYNLEGLKLKSGTVNVTPYTLDLDDLIPNVYILSVGGDVFKIVKSE